MAIESEQRPDPAFLNRYNKLANPVQQISANSLKLHQKAWRTPIDHAPVHRENKRLARQLFQHLPPEVMGIDLSEAGNPFIVQREKTPPSVETIYQLGQIETQFIIPIATGLDITHTPTFAPRPEPAPASPPVVQEG